MSAGARLGLCLGLARPEIAVASSALWRRPVTAGRYVRYLSAMHGVVRASVPLMQRAADQCPPGRLRAYLLAHIGEEAGHDAWLLADLAAAGADPAAIATAPVLPEVAALVGPAYYRVEHEHPVALLGYVAVLEANAPAPWLAARLASETGLPPAAFRTLAAHAELDGGHLRDLLALLDVLPLGPAQQQAAALCALHTADALVRLFLRLADPDPFTEATHDASP
ncbi:iron-containing redox enzyme family protein [Streptomyces sp.]|uniref:iron-containing redox enzyme family protein n=1 Tax=Streptomyces sp. TaxID=1931 RepID=UPI002F418379